MNTPSQLFSLTFSQNYFVPQNQTNTSSQANLISNTQVPNTTYSNVLQTQCNRSWNFTSSPQNKPYTNPKNRPQKPRKPQYPPLSHRANDPVYQMQQRNTQNTYPTTNITQPLQSFIPLPQYMPLQQDTFINTSAPIPEPMKPFDCLDHSYKPEKYLH